MRVDRDNLELGGGDGERGMTSGERTEGRLCVERLGVHAFLAMAALLVPLTALGGTPTISSPDRCGPPGPVNEQNYNAELGARAFMALAEAISLGPSLSTALVITEGGHAGGLVAGGGSFAMFGSPTERMGVAYANFDGGYRFTANYGFLHLGMGLGWRGVSLGLGSTLALEPDQVGFALDPELTVHLRWPMVRRPALQFFARGEFFLSGRERFPHQVNIGVRVIFDLVAKCPGHSKT